MWEIGLLAFLIALGFGVAIIMARKRKASTIVQVVQKDNIDIEKLATVVARAVAEEILSKLPKGGFHQSGGSLESDIQMDESIIPIAIETAVEATNLGGMAKEEKAVDKDLEKSKAKLAGILKKKG